MKRCPRCNKFTVAYDGYRGVYRCMDDNCSCVIIDANTYSILRRDPDKKTINRIEVKGGKEKKILKKYKMY